MLPFIQEYVNSIHIEHIEEKKNTSSTPEDAIVRVYASAFVGMARASEKNEAKLR